jgi:peptidoglycan biosynthesis protein MviN/MurJ (putative lipid II flippase)
MLWMLDRKIGGLDLRRSAMPIAKMIFATLVMGAVCYALQHSPLYPHGVGRFFWGAQLGLMLVVGAGVYIGLCALMGVSVLQELFPRRAASGANAAEIRA